MHAGFLTHAYAKSLFYKVLNHTPWPFDFPPLASLAEDLPPVLNFTPQFDTTVTLMEVTVHNVKVVKFLIKGLIPELSLLALQGKLR